MTGSSRRPELLEPGLWADIRGALRRQTHDWTQLPVRRAVLLLSIPMMLEMCLESLFGVVDMLFVGRLGTNAVAAVGLTGSLVTIVFSLAAGLGMAAAATVARRIGEGNREQACVAAGQALVLCVFASVPVGLLGAVFAKDLLSLMGLHPEAIEEGWRFTAILLGGNTSILLLFVLSAILRAAGDATFAFRTLWIANGVNILLDPILIFGFGWIPALGVEGAAIATTVSRGLGVAYQLWVLFGGRCSLPLKLRHLRPDPTVAWRLSKTSFWGTLQMALTTASLLGLMRIVALYGDTAIAGYTVALRVLMVIMLPSFGIANAAGTLVGQSLGSKQPDRAGSAIWICGAWNLGVLTVVGIGTFVSAPWLVGAFINDEQSIRIGVACLRITAVGLPPLGLGMAFAQAFSGAGDTQTAAWVNLVTFWFIQIPAAWILSHSLSFGAHGVFWAIAITNGVFLLVTWLLFRWGRWKQFAI